MGFLYPPTTMNKPNLILHCGASYASRSEVIKTKTPNPTESWYPIPHDRFIQTVEHSLNATKLKIGSVAHSLSHGGQRYFGLMEIKARKANEDYCWVIGLRNSHDKTFPAGICAGASCFVCDNLSFSGEVNLSRRHTRNITRDLPLITERAVGLLLEKWHDQDKRIAAYKNAIIEDQAAHDLIIRATDVSVCSNRLIPTVLHEWRKPKHEVFEPRNVWSLFNAFTESLKEGNLVELPKRTQALHALLDVAVGLN